MIEIKQRGSTDQLGEYELYVDSVLVQDTHIYKTFADSAYWVTIYDQDFAERVAAYPFSEIPSSIDRLTLNFSFDWSELVEVSVHRDNEKYSFEIWFEFTFEIDGWKQFYSISEYVEEFDKILRALNNPEIFWEYDDEVKANGLKIRFLAASSQALIREEIYRRSEVIHELHAETLRSLTTKFRNESVVVYFDFPEEVKVPCEQYLLYFIQFLKDLDVEATAELQHQLGQVLFAVTPINALDALDKIRTALEIYLGLPASPISDVSLIYDEIALQRLAANIYHLKSQLSLTQAILQAKDATIQAQQITIEHQRCLLGGEIIIKSLKEVIPESKGEDKEDLLGGTLAITKLKGKGIEVNLPEIYRRLKRLFSEDK